LEELAVGNLLPLRPAGELTIIHEEIKETAAVDQDHLRQMAGTLIVVIKKNRCPALPAEQRYLPMQNCW